MFAFASLLKNNFFHKKFFFLLTRGSLAQAAHHHPQLCGADEPVLILVKQHEGLLELFHQVLRQSVLHLVEDK